MTTWDYIRELFRPGDRIVVCWKVHTEKLFNQRFLTADAACSDRYQRFLRAMNAQGNNIYIGMNPLRASARSRTKADIAEIRRIYLDVDTNADEVLKTILDNSPLPKPNYVLNTSPGKYQIIWNVAQFQRDQAEQLMRSLCRQFHADPANVDISRVFRLPGLHNKKYEATFQVTVKKLSSTLYTPRDFPAADPAPATAPRRKRAPSELSNTPSHHDWAWVCRQLWHAPDFESVRAQLTSELERRAELRKKPKPRYYAEVTFENACSYIAEKRNFSK